MHAILPAKITYAKQYCTSRKIKHWHPIDLPILHTHLVSRFLESQEIIHLHSRCSEYLFWGSLLNFVIHSWDTFATYFFPIFGYHYLYQWQMGNAWCNRRIWTDFKLPLLSYLTLSVQLSQPSSNSTTLYYSTMRAINYLLGLRFSHKITLDQNVFYLTDEVVKYQLWKFRYQNPDIFRWLLLAARCFVVAKICHLCKGHFSDKSVLRESFCLKVVWYLTEVWSLMSKTASQESSLWH